MDISHNNSINNNYTVHIFNQKKEIHPVEKIRQNIQLNLNLASKLIKIFSEFEKLQIPFYTVKIKFKTSREQCEIYNNEKFKLILYEEFQLIAFNKIIFCKNSKIANPLPLDIATSLKLRSIISEFTKDFSSYLKPYVTSYCHYFFKSSIYHIYLLNLLEFIDKEKDKNNELKQELNGNHVNIVNFNSWVGLIREVDREVCVSFINHQTMIRFFRQIVEMNTKNTDKSFPHFRLFLYRIIEWIISEVNLSIMWMNFIILHVEDINLDSQKIDQAIIHYSTCLSSQNLFKGISNRANFISDYYLMGDMPSVLWTQLIEGIKVKFIRTPNVTLLECGKYSIIPEVLHFFHYCQSQKQNCLMVNFMQNCHEETESLQAKCIESLDLNDATNILHIITLDKTSQFYWQSGDFSDIIYKELGKAEVFHGICLEQMFNIGDNFYFSKKTKIEPLKNYVSRLFIAIHKHYFDNKESLTTLERQLFIDLTYFSIVMRYIKDYKISNCLMSCRASVDRNPTFYTGLKVFNQKNNHISMSDEELKLLMANLFCPGLLIHNRPPYINYVNRLIRVVELIQNKPSFDFENI